MTCIVALKTDTHLYMAADTQGTGGSVKYAYKNKKIFEKGEFVFGVCGCYLFMQTLEHSVSIPRRYENETDMGYLVNSFIPAVQLAMKKFNQEYKMNGACLFFYRNEIYQMEYNYQILSPKENFMASGSGEDHAVAYLYATKNTDMDQEERIKESICCASEYVTSVNNDIDIIIKEIK